MKRYLTSSSGKAGDGGSASGGDTAAAAAKRPKSTPSPEEFLRLVSWNVDGLDGSHVVERAERVCRILLGGGGGDDSGKPAAAPAAADATISSSSSPSTELPPDIVLLQEVTPENAPVFLSAFLEAGYTCQPTDVPFDSPYFTLCFLRASRLAAVTDGDSMTDKPARTPFPGSHMGRDLVRVVAKPLLMLQGEGKEDKPPPPPPSSSSSSSLPSLCIMTSHLESLGDPANVRQRCVQLSDVLDQLLAFDGPALFAGDTNLREKEVAAEPKYKAVIDAWQAAGSPADAKATWDLQLNDNKKIPNASFLPRMRLDRLLLNPRFLGGGGEGKEKMKPGDVVKQWELLGKERMPSCGLFPSDHFGISCLIRVPKATE